MACDRMVGLVVIKSLIWPKTLRVCLREAFGGSAIVFTTALALLPGITLAGATRTNMFNSITELTISFVDT